VIQGRGTGLRARVLAAAAEFHGRAAYRGAAVCHGGFRGGARGPAHFAAAGPRVGGGGHRH